MEKVNAFCRRCNAIEPHVFRLYEGEKKVYGVTLESFSHISSICQNCSLEKLVPKIEQSLLVTKYKKLLLCQEGYTLVQKGKTSDAIKFFKKVLEENPRHPQASYGLARALISLKKYREAEPFVLELTKLYPHDKDVVELRTIIETNLMK